MSEQHRTTELLSLATRPNADDLVVVKDEATASAFGWTFVRSMTRNEQDRYVETGELPEIETDTSDDSAQDHGFDVCPDCGNTGTVMTMVGYADCTRFLTCWSDPS